MKKAAEFVSPYLLDRLENPRFDLSWHSSTQSPQKQIALIKKSWRQMRFVLHITADRYAVSSNYLEIVNHQ